MQTACTTPNDEYQVSKYEKMTGVATLSNAALSTTGGVTKEQKPHDAI